MGFNWIHAKKEVSIMKLLKYGSLKKVLFICVSFSFLCFSSYASNRTAGSLEKGNWQVGVHLDGLLISTTTFESINFSVAPDVAVTGGLSEKLDLTLSNTSIEFKYSFLNNKEGFSMAGVGAWAFAFSAENANDTIDLATGLALGPVLSYKSGEFESYVRVVYSYDYNFGFMRAKRARHAHHQYINSSLGFNFWLSESVAFNLNIGGDILLFDRIDVGSGTSSI